MLHLLSFLGVHTAFLRGGMLYFYPYFQEDFTSSWIAVCVCFFCPFPPCLNGLRQCPSIVPGERILTYHETVLAAGRWHLGVPPLLCEGELPEDWELTAVCGSIVSYSVLAVRESMLKRGGNTVTLGLGNAGSHVRA